MATAQQQPRIRQNLALVIGNSNYSRSYNKLDHSLNNVIDLSESLKKIGFNVTTINDLTKKDMITRIIQFCKTVNDGDLVLFYFSGHGCCVNGQNYLIPVDDTKIDNTDRDMQDFGVNVEGTIARLVERNPSYATIIILDCCTPYKLNLSSASPGKLHGSLIYHESS